MGTYRLTRPWVPSGPGGGNVLEPGTLVGEGTGYPIPTVNGVERPPAGAEKAPTPAAPKPEPPPKSDPGVTKEGKELGLADKADSGPAKATTMKGGDK